jgi:hypothetical protein
MILPGRLAIVNRCRAGNRVAGRKLRVRHRAACLFSQRSARSAALGYRFIVRGSPVNDERQTPNGERRNGRCPQLLNENAY